MCKSYLQALDIEFWNYFCLVDKHAGAGKRRNRDGKETAVATNEGRGIQLVIAAN